MLHMGRALEGMWTPKWDIESYVESAKPRLCCWEHLCRSVTACWGCPGALSKGAREVCEGWSLCWGDQETPGGRGSILTPWESCFKAWEVCDLVTRRMWRGVRGWEGCEDCNNMGNGVKGMVTVVRRESRTNVDRLLLFTESLLEREKDVWPWAGYEWTGYEAVLAVLLNCKHGERTEMRRTWEALQGVTGQIN